MGLSYLAVFVYNSQSGKMSLFQQMPQYITNEKSTFVQVMFCWRQTATMSKLILLISGFVNINPALLVTSLHEQLDSRSVTCKVCHKKHWSVAANIVEQQTSVLKLRYVIDCLYLWWQKKLLHILTTVVYFPFVGVTNRGDSLSAWQWMKLPTPVPFRFQLGSVGLVPVTWEVVKSFANCTGPVF